MDTNICAGSCDLAGIGSVSEIQLDLDFDELDLDNGVHYQDALFNGIEMCDNKISGEGYNVLDSSTLEKLGTDRKWFGKTQRLGITPLSFCLGTDGYHHADLSCIHDELWETMPEYVGITANRGVLRLCELQYKCDNPTLAVEIAPGSWLPVFKDCINGICSCVYTLEGESTQLRPCRFAASVWGFGDKITTDDLFVLTGVCRGFRIVDHGCKANYFCRNYPSLLEGCFFEEMNDIVKNELSESSDIQKHVF